MVKPTIGDVLRERKAPGRVLRLWLAPAEHWIGEDEAGSLWRVPADDDTWSQRQPCPDARIDQLQQADPRCGESSGWPGVLPLAHEPEGAE